MRGSLLYRAARHGEALQTLVEYGQTQDLSQAQRRRLAVLRDETDRLLQSHSLPTGPVEELRQRVIPPIKA